MAQPSGTSSGHRVSLILEVHPSKCVGYVIIIAVNHILIIFIGYIFVMVARYVLVIFVGGPRKTSRA